MKKLLLVILLLPLLSLQTFSQSGKNCFNTQFHKDASTLDPMNAYLLGYLCTMSYADYLRHWFPGVSGYEKNGDSVQFLESHNDKFVRAFSNKLGYLFVDKDAPATLSLASATSLQSINTSVSDLSLSTTMTKSLASAADPTVSVYAVANGQSVVFDFENKCNFVGYDPEAVVISTPTTIYVVFRGTDRVACNSSSTGYQWAEWMASDFQFLKKAASVINVNVQGNVHRGMVESLMAQGFADSLASRVKRYGGATKKVWITGHSLGGAHAQLFSIFLKTNYQISAQGVYVYESPHPGDQAFVNYLNTSIGKSKIQRFEFGDDPICTLPPISFSFGRAGERNYFKDYSTATVRTEQTIADDAKILCALGNLAPEQTPVSASFLFPPLCPGSTCYHHPTFILEALKHQLNSSQFPLLPPNVPLPVAGDACTTGNLTKAADNDLINNTATAVETTIAQIAWGAVNLADNLLGTGLTEGNYKIACYGFKNNSKRYLKWDGSVGHQLTISTSASNFIVTHKATGGYQFWISAGNMAADVNFNLVGAPDGTEKTNNVLMKEKDGIIGDEETWYLFKVPNTTNVFVLYNWNSGKVLDAPDDCLTGGSCSVEERSASSNNATQVWILEKQ